MAFRIIQNFVSGFGVIVQDFFEQDKEGGAIPTSSLTRMDKPEAPTEQQASTAETVEEKSKEQTAPEPRGEGQEKQKAVVEPAVETHEKVEPSAPKGHNEQLEEEDDNDKDLQAAMYASMQAPRSPQADSGAQSSNPKGALSLQIEEDEALQQLSTLMNEHVDLESRPNPTIVQKLPAQSIHKVIKDLETKLNEIASQKTSDTTSKVRKIQEEPKQPETHRELAGPGQGTVQTPAVSQPSSL